MYWNYRVVKTKLNEEENSYDVCEVYYDKDGKAVSKAIDKNVLSHDSLEDLNDCMEKVKEAFMKPVLEKTKEGYLEI